jgi:hypothetical protein
MGTDFLKNAKTYLFKGIEKGIGKVVSKFHIGLFYSSYLDLSFVKKIMEIRFILEEIYSFQNLVPYMEQPALRG